MTDTDCISVYELFRTEERTTLYDQNINSKARVVVNQGGTSSGKTYAIMQVLFELGYEQPNQIITVVGQDIPNLKVGAYRDAKTIMDKYDTVDAAYPQINEGERIIKGFNGSIIEFKSYADAQDAKSGKRDYLFINEANGISYEVYWQLAIRTRKKIFIDYNPSARFWVHDELIGREGVETLYSWYKHNQFLTDEEQDINREIRQIPGIYKASYGEQSTVSLMEADQPGLAESKYGLSTVRHTQFARGTWYGHQGRYSGLTSNIYYQRETGITMALILNGYEPQLTDNIVQPAFSILTNMERIEEIRTGEKSGT